MVDVVMPKMGESITEGTVLEWKKTVGDPILKDEILLEISTDKVDSDVPSPASGMVIEIIAQVNETIPVVINMPPNPAPIKFPSPCEFMSRKSLAIIEIKGIWVQPNVSLKIIIPINKRSNFSFFKYKNPFFIDWNTFSFICVLGGL